MNSPSRNAGTTGTRTEKGPLAHTPGPWIVLGPQWGFSQINGPNREMIFGLAAGGPEEKQPDAVCEANARLIAAAPDLLEALTDLLESARGRGPKDGKVMARADAAVSKALGPQVAGLKSREDQ